MATSRTQPTVGLGDPNILRSTESQLAQAAIIANGKSTVSDGEAIFVGTTLKVNANNVTLTTSANNQPADLVTVYSSLGATYVSAIDQTVNQTVINQVGVNAIIAGNGISISSSSASGTGTVTINSTAGNIAVVNLDGNITNVLHGDGSWSADLTTYGNSNVVTLLSAFGSNTITTTGNVSVGNIIGNGQALTAIAGANVTGNVGNALNAYAVAGANVSGFVANANVANTAFAVAAANVSGLGNIATINLTGSNSNVLYGNGVFAPASGGGNANTGNVTFDDINIIGTGNLNLQPNPADAAAYVNIYLTGAADIHMAAGAAGANLILGTDEEANVAVLQGGNVAIQAGNVAGTKTWTFDTNGDINIPPNATSTTSGRIQSANGYPTLLAYGTGSHGGPELTWTNTGNVNDLGNATILRNTMYINESGLWVGMNENFVANTFAGTWNFTPNGTTIFPTLEVDLHNGGVQTGQVLQFGNSQQAIITGPTPSANNAAERLIIQGQRGNGTGEGGDIYVWGGDADTNGGDIKIYAGDADNVAAGTGGYVNIDGGAGFDYGGGITLTGGISANGYGGTVNITGGSGEIAGGAASFQGGYGGNGQGGTVQITGGGSTNGQASYGNVEIGSGSYAWTFNNAGNLTLPIGGNLIVSGSIISSGASPAPTLSGFSSVSAITLSVSGNVTGAYILGNGSGLTSLPIPTVSQDITSNGAMSIMTYDGNLKYVSYATVEPSTGNIAGGNISTTGVLTANTANITTGNITTINSGLLQNGNSNVTITSNANVSVFTAGNATAQFVVTSSGANISGTANVVGNANVGNLGTGRVIATGNISGTQLISNIAIGTAPLVVTSTTRVANLSVDYANVADFITVAAGTGNNFFVFANAATGNVSEVTSTGITANLSTNAITATTFIGALANGNSNVNIPSANGNVNISAVGNANIVVVTGTGANVTGTLNVTGNITGNTSGFAIGYLNIPQIAAANATLGLTDAGKHYYSTTAGNLTLTIPLNSSVAFATGTAISVVVQAAGNVLVNAASGVTLYMGGNATAGNRVVSTYGMATLMKVATDTWFINGTGVA